MGNAHAGNTFNSYERGFLEHKQTRAVLFRRDCQQIYQIIRLCNIVKNPKWREPITSSQTDILQDLMKAVFIS